jgi:hypothetical protein
VGKILEIKIYSLTDLSLFKSYIYSLDLSLPYTPMQHRDLLLTFGNMLKEGDCPKRCFELFLPCVVMPE